MDSTNIFSSITTKPYYQKILLFIVWILVQCFLVWQNGIVTILEADKYISQAEYFIKTGHLSSSNYWLYSTQVFLIVAVIKLHLSFAVIVVMQILLNLLATWMFYKLCMFLLKNPFLAFLATAYFHN